MKKLILILLISFSGFAQQFEVTPDGLFAKGTEKETFVVIDAEGKNASELYNSAINYVNETYKNPNEVLKGKIENEYLRFETFVENFMIVNNSGAKVKINATYTIELKFKDNKIRFEIINLEMKAPNGGFLVDYMGSIWKGYPIYNKKRELRLPDAKQNIETYFDTQVIIISDYLNNKKTAKDDW
jgi:hypothetical protein